MIDTVYSAAEFQTLVQPLIGLTVALPWKGYGSAIFLELGELSPLESKRQHHGKGQACISVEWDWRAESSSSILYGSSNNRPKIKRGIATLVGAAIQDISLVGPVPEIVVRFSNGHCLRSMVMAAGHPEWSIKLPGGRWLYAKAGDLMVGEGTSNVTEEEQKVFDLAESTAGRWGIPSAGPAQGSCINCDWFVFLDGDGQLLDYGACTSSESSMDGRVVNRDSGCSFFTATAETDAQSN